MNLPNFSLVRQIAEQPRIADVYFEVQNQFRDSKLLARIQPGQRIAVACGSRGIANYSSIVRATLEVLHNAGAKPFIVAAMGSHGGATAEGQRELLASYGITETDLGVEIRTEMTAEIVGTNGVGDPVWWDSNALKADGVITISRIKPHTDFRGRFESGIAKMAVIGLGKRDGASQHHRWGVRGLRDIMPDSARVILEKTKLLGGLAILENSRDETALLHVVDRDELLEVEPELLDRAKSMMGKIPFEKVDILVIGELGKNYSGSGIDPNVVGRFLVETAPEMEPATPCVTRMVCLDVSAESHGNATGIGLADITTERAIAAIDPGPFRMNNLTACCLWRCKLPLAFANDGEAMQAAIDTCWQPIDDHRKIVFIPNSLEVGEMWVSPALIDEVKAHPDLQIVGEVKAIPFDSNGNIIQEQLFPHSIRAKRMKV